MLSKSRHRYIVSKSSFGGQYELPDNMWGQNYLPQIKILPIIDLIVTHGGNNTFTELMYYGKLMLVIWQCSKSRGEGIRHSIGSLHLHTNGTDWVDREIVER